MLVRRERLLELGGFDETFFMDFEDLDLCWRAWLRGWASVYVPDAVVRHRVGAVPDGGGPDATARVVAPQPDAVRAQVPSARPTPRGSSPASCCASRATRTSSRRRSRRSPASCPRSSA